MSIKWYKAQIYEKQNFLNAKDNEQFFDRFFLFIN